VGPDAARRAEESLRAIEAGGLPLAAQERLANLRTEGGASTSDLSTAEFLLVRQAGFRPVSQVMGTCFYRVGWQYLPGERAPGNYYKEGQATPGSPYAGGFEYDSSGRRIYSGAAFGQVFELDTETQAWQEARRLALGRLLQEARLANADAVVGLRLERGTYEWSRNHVEFLAVGTAVCSNRYDLGGEPVLTNLSGQDFAKLYTSGYWPVGIVANTAVVYVMTGSQQNMGARRFAPNQEMQDYTNGVQHARKVAITRMGTGARELEAAGIVGLSLEVAVREHEHEGSRSRRARDLIVTVHSLGTAIVEIEQHADPRPSRIVLSLNDEPIGRPAARGRKAKARSQRPE
jgi:uncharacterized protein YbjQ (UPF0145 family)